MLHIVLSPFPRLQSRLVVFCLSGTFLLTSCCEWIWDVRGRQLVVSGEQHGQLCISRIQWDTGRNIRHYNCHYTLQPVTRSSVHSKPRASCFDMPRYKHEAMIQQVLHAQNTSAHGRYTARRMNVPGGGGPGISATARDVMSLVNLHRRV